jgi:hypothetical protein
VRCFGEVTSGTCSGMSRPFSWPQPQPAATVAPAGTADGWMAPDGMLSGLWLCGVAVVLGSWVLRWRRTAALASVAQPIVAGREVDTLRCLEPILGISRPVKLVSSPVVTEPGVFGIAKPTILWPHRLGERVDERSVWELPRSGSVQCFLSSPFRIRRLEGQRQGRDRHSTRPRRHRKRRAQRQGGRRAIPELTIDSANPQSIIHNPSICNPPSAVRNPVSPWLPSSSLRPRYPPSAGPSARPPFPSGLLQPRPFRPPPLLALRTAIRRGR